MTINTDFCHENGAEIVVSPSIVSPWLTKYPRARPVSTAARSGDKGNSANIAIFARKPEYLPWLRKILPPETITAQLGHLVTGPTERFEAPGLNALNFLIQNALGGGGMASLRIDPQGKAYAQMVLEMEVKAPRSYFI